MKNPVTYAQPPGMLLTFAVSSESELQENIDFISEIDDSGTVVDGNRSDEESEGVLLFAKISNSANTQLSITLATKSRATR